MRSVTSGVPTVYVVEDDVDQSELLRHVLRGAGLNVETFSSAEDLLAKATPDWQGCLVLDIELTGMNGLELHQRLSERGIGLPTLFLTAHGTVATAVQAMKQQAMDFVEKPIDPAVIVPRVKQALQLDETRRNARAQHADIAARFDTLTPREREVMDLIVHGLANKQVAAKLHLSEKTVEAHRGNVMRKMQADSLAELVRMAMALEGRSDPQT